LLDICVEKHECLLTRVGSREGCGRGGLASRQYFGVSFGRYRARALTFDNHLPLVLCTKLHLKSSAKSISSYAEAYHAVAIRVDSYFYGSRSSTEIRTVIGFRRTYLPIRKNRTFLQF
jgi:hypothetical protein